MEHFCVKNATKFVLVFDVDGHLIDTESLGYQEYYSVIKKYFLSKNNSDALRKFEKIFAPENNGMNWFVQNMMGKSHDLVSKLIYKECICSFPEYLAKLEAENQEIVDTLRSLPQTKPYASFRYYAKQQYRKNRAPFQEEFKKIRLEVDKRVIDRTNENSLLPGAKELILKLVKNKNISVHFVSGSSRDRLEKIFKKVGIFNIIDFKNNVRGGEDFKYKTEALLQILNQEGYYSEANNELHSLPFSHMLFSGDSIYDAMSSVQVGGKGIYFIGNVGASHCAGCKTEHAQRLLNNGADIVISSTSELGKAIQNRIKNVQKEEQKALQIMVANINYGALERSIS